MDWTFYFSTFASAESDGELRNGGLYLVPVSSLFSYRYSTS